MALTMLLVVVGVLMSSVSAFVWNSIPRCRNCLRVRNVPRMLRNVPCVSPRNLPCVSHSQSALYMTPRAYKSRSEIPMIMKKARSKKTYNVPGYVKGDYDQLKAVFRAYAIEGKMTYESFIESKYLRFWPGRTRSLTPPSFFFVLPVFQVTESS